MIVGTQNCKVTQTSRGLVEFVLHVVIATMQHHGQAGWSSSSSNENITNVVKRNSTFSLLSPSPTF